MPKNTAFSNLAIKVCRTNSIQGIDDPRDYPSKDLAKTNGPLMETPSRRLFPRYSFVITRSISNSIHEHTRDTNISPCNLLETRPSYGLAVNWLLPVLLGLNREFGLQGKMVAREMSVGEARHTRQIIPIYIS